MKRNSARSKLPGIAFATVATGMTIAIFLGESRYQRIETTKTAEELNQLYGVSRAQARAMLAGLLVGWRSTLTNPDLYGANGELVDAPAAGVTEQQAFGRENA
jgi:hypothetical protein